ncbi:MAG: winged helix-turn-helix domain-containing protein [Roseitalea porphyridii]
MNRIVTDPSHTASPRHLALGDAVFDRFTRTMVVDGREHRLEPRLAGVLECLIADAGIPVTREALLDRVWGDDGSDEALTQSVSRLRRMLGEGCEIRTMPKIGYVLMADPMPVDSVEQVTVPDAAPSHAQRAPRAVPVWAGVSIGALATALIGVLVFTLFFRVEREIEIFDIAPAQTDTAVLP